MVAGQPLTWGPLSLAPQPYPHLSGPQSEPCLRGRLCGRRDPTLGRYSRWAPSWHRSAHRRQQDTRLAQGSFGSLPPEPRGTTGHPQAKSSLTPAALCGRLRAAPWALAGSEGRPSGPALWGLGTCTFAILNERALLPDQTGMDPRRAAAILGARPRGCRDTPTPAPRPRLRWPLSPGSFFP